VLDNIVLEYLHDPVEEFVGHKELVHDTRCILSTDVLLFVDAAFGKDNVY
jgi:hypothetical protein